ncbi:hypothetical protein [Nostoc sp. DSM 114167]|uniref:hypothetical protein n=1 Tax=Nostoc sp. DSM 114167 TaxID=3439050 RepID=UPI00404560BF
MGTANPATLRLMGEYSCPLSLSSSRSLVFAQCWQAAISAWFEVGLELGAEYLQDNISGHRP